MNNENAESGTSRIDNAGFVERFLKPLLKLLIAFIVAFIGSSLVGIVIFFIVFIIIFIAGGIEGRYPLTVFEIPNLLIASGFFTFLYGILVPVLAFLQLILMGIPAALLGWKLKLIRWWTCVLVGALISLSPWVLFDGITTVLQSSSGDLPRLSESLLKMGILSLLGICGGAGGLMFWLSLRMLRFSDIKEPIPYMVRATV